MWKDILGWEDLYEVSSSGEVRNKITNRLIVGDINTAGYHRVCLYNKAHTPPKQRFFRHRLVATAFLPNPFSLPEVNHINHRLNDNTMQNLEWCSRAENELDSRIYGNKEYKPFVVRYMAGQEKIFHSKPHLAQSIGVTTSLVSHWLKNRSRTYTNYGIASITYLPKS